MTSDDDYDHSRHDDRAVHFLDAILEDISCAYGDISEDDCEQGFHQHDPVTQAFLDVMPSDVSLMAYNMQMEIGDYVLNHYSHLRFIIGYALPPDSRVLPDVHLVSYEKPTDLEISSIHSYL